MLQRSKRIFLQLLRSNKRVFFLLLLVSAIIFLYIISQPYVNFLKKNKITPAFVINLLFSHDLPIKKDNNRTNFLILGIAGENHDGIDLTDTMIFLSVNLINNDVFTVSIPRDIWSDTLKDKVNTAYHYGEQKKPSGGFILARSIIEEVIGQPIQYTILIDFNGFKNLIDLIGGLDIDIENSFTDKKYPVAGKENDECEADPEYKCRYETLVFEKGIKHMNGDLALKFVRSRYSESEEGTDYGRSKRQQKVLIAFQKKLLSVNMFDLNKISQLIEGFQKTIKTDISFTEAGYLAKFGIKFKGAVRSMVFDSGKDFKEGLLINPPIEEYENRWVLVPKTGNFDIIHSYINCHLVDSICKMTEKNAQ